MKYYFYILLLLIHSSNLTNIYPNVICYLDFQKYHPNCHVSHAYYRNNNPEKCIYKIICNNKTYTDEILIKNIKDLVLS